MKKYILISIIILVAIGTGYFVFKKIYSLHHKTELEEDASQNQNTSNPSKQSDVAHNEDIVPTQQPAQNSTPSSSVNGSNTNNQNNNTSNPVPSSLQQQTPVNKEFSDQFSSEFTLEEDGKMGASKSINWWVNSGAYLYVKNGIGQTIKGHLAQDNIWRIRFNSNNPGETDNGYHPQNIFRLVLKSKWKNFEQQAYYQITADNLSSDTHRAGSNGLLLFNRYLDGYNLYYTGIRVDGTATIKKKLNNTYYSMAQQVILPGVYNHDTNPNLLPKNKWLGLKSIVKDNPDGSVSIELYTDMDNSGNWVLAAKAVDDNKTYGGKAITESAYAGIRTDFMDVEFDNYKITEIN